MATRYSQLNIDTDTLKQKTGVTDTQLDQTIEQEQLWSLAGLLGSYDKFVRKPGFDLNNADIADLKECAFRNGYQLAMYEALRKWENIILDFTYRSLLEILISLREGALADQVCRTFIQTQASEPNKEDTVSLSPAPDRMIGPPIRDSVEPNLTTGTATADHIKEFETRFMVLQKIALKEITEKRIPVTDFRQTLMIMPSSIKNENKDFIKSNYSLFEKAKSIESIFLEINFYISFIDFSLLEHIIEQFGSDSLKQDMSTYAEDMRHFRMNTPVSEALGHLPKNSDAPAGYSRLTVKFAFDIHTATLEDLETYRKRFASDFLLSQLALSLFDLQESSLLVTWLVPAAVGAMISDQVQKKSSSFFLNNSILKLSLEGDCLYPMATFSQSGKRDLMIEAVAGKPGLTSLEPHQRKVVKPTINLEPNHCGLAIVVPSHMTTHILMETLRFAVYEPQNKPSLMSYMQVVDLVELKHHPIIVMVYGLGPGNLLHTLCGLIDIKEDIMAPLFPPIATHLADNPKIFLFNACFGSSEHSVFQFIEASWENYIVGYIACDYFWVTRIVEDELASPSLSVQEIFTLISDKLPPHATMTVIDCLKEPVYLYPRGPELIETHSESQESSEESYPLLREQSMNNQSLGSIHVYGNTELISKNIHWNHRYLNKLH
ncbi:uncharacterized protein LOC135340528 isoform X2 [Halichondria panicea]|uniref:uncharacterized protein LOC135340528 isoform X2 n=1 Tax=Halichondria panicea TaxID=6063 RepID=UPI00312B2EB0